MLSAFDPIKALYDLFQSPYVLDYLFIFLLGWKELELYFLPSAALYLLTVWLEHLIVLATLYSPVAGNPEAPVRSFATLFTSHLHSSYQQLNQSCVCQLIVCALTADVPLCSFQTAQEWWQGGNLGSSSSWIQGIKPRWSPDLESTLEAASSHDSAVASGQVVRRLASLSESWLVLMRVFSKRRSLSFNHNSGLQPGPSNSCWLRPSSCGIPRGLLVAPFSYYLRSSDHSAASHLKLWYQQGVFVFDCVFAHKLRLWVTRTSKTFSAGPEHTHKVIFPTVNVKIKRFFIVCFVDVLVSILFHCFHCLILQFLSSYISASCVAWSYDPVSCNAELWLDKHSWVPERLNSPQRWKEQNLLQFIIQITCGAIVELFFCSIPAKNKLYFLFPVNSLLCYCVIGVS